jgi:hypothetical protein
MHKKISKPLAILIIIAFAGFVGSMTLIWSNYFIDESSTIIQSIHKKVRKNNNISNLIGGDRDEHGCIGSAGYSWCEEKKKCLRSWEEECATSENMTKNKCEKEAGKWGRMWGAMADGTKAEFNGCTCPGNQKFIPEGFNEECEECLALQEKIKSYNYCNSDDDCTYKIQNCISLGGGYMPINYKELLSVNVLISRFERCSECNYAYYELPPVESINIKCIKSKCKII